MRIRHLCALATALPLTVALAACTGPQGESGGGDGDAKLSFANSYPDNHPHNTCGTELVRDAVADEGIEIEIFPSSQLGGDVDRFTSVMSGDIDIDLQGASGLAGTFAPIGVMDMAYAFEDADQLFAWFDESEEAQALRDEFEQETGAKILDVWYYGDRTFSANTPIRTPEDLAGLRMRFPDSTVHLQNARALGAEAVAVAFEEIYLALQQGTVDGQENPIAVVSANSYDEVQDYVSLNRHSVGSQLVVVNSDTWERLSSDQQEALETAVRETRAEDRACIEDETESIIEEWGRTGGPEVVEDVDVEAFRSRARDYLLSNLEGRELELYQDILEFQPGS
ncbi:DctP family TRAP transporter solute-binding subunit [uncultured Aeromicrobium sp.]|uniref:DctP family TRAP transporter solute-binding subunit n=1 Tax=uncultured Aeromicrobium sp. TaxID=337820 RepID=UPI0025F430B9|nr:DctP family TRAP transporter solute-binding subunit [uncultured Aeromicrobium sp.]